MNTNTTNNKNFGNGRVLFVENEQQLVYIYRDYFSVNGYNILSANTVKEALEITVKEKPDAVLLDIIIPKEDKDIVNPMAEQGYNYLKAVKENPKTKDIPIIVFTNLNTGEDRKKCEKMGAAAYIFKRDCTPREVLDAVAKVIETSHAETMIQQTAI